MIESTTQEEAEVATHESNKSTWKKVFLFINCILLIVGNSGSPLVMRLYFIHGGERIWFSSFLQTVAFPLLLIPLGISYFRSSRRGTNKIFLMKPRIFLGSIILGILTGLDNYLYSYGLSRLPVSTQSLIIATQLAFTATFAFLLVKQKFTAFTVNSIVLLCIGAAVLGLHANGDRPEGETGKEYSLGFAMTVLAALLAGFIFPFVEMTYKKGKQAVTYTLVLEIQLVMCIVATGFCAVGMIINKDFQAIPREAKDFGLGEGKYYLVLVATALLVQCFFLSAIGVVFYASSLLSGIIISVSLPLTELLAVLFFHEKFQAEKGVSLVLSLWGFASYFYGEIKDNKNKNKKKNEQSIGKPETQMVDQVVVQ